MIEDSKDESPLDWLPQDALERAMKAVKEEGHRQVIVLLSTPGQRGFRVIRAGANLPQTIMLLSTAQWAVCGFKTEEEHKDSDGFGRPA